MSNFQRPPDNSTGCGESANKSVKQMFFGILVCPQAKHTLGELGSSLVIGPLPKSIRLSYTQVLL